MTSPEVAGVADPEFAESSVSIFGIGDLSSTPARNAVCRFAHNRARASAGNNASASSRNFGSVTGTSRALLSTSNR